MHTGKREGIYGMMAEFDSAQQLYDAVCRVREIGYRQLDAYSPFPIEEVAHEVADHKKSKVSLIVLIFGLLGAAAGFGLQVFVSAIDYPLNVGGRPLISWPAFIPVTFETTILFAAFSAAIGMMLLNGLPQPYHPVFNVKAFDRASQDAFFLVVEAEDPLFDATGTRGVLEGLGATEVNDVAW